MFKSKPDFPGAWWCFEAGSWCIFHVAECHGDLTLIGLDKPPREGLWVKIEEPPKIPPMPRRCLVRSGDQLQWLVTLRTGAPLMWDEYYWREGTTREKWVSPYPVDAVVPHPDNDPDLAALIEREYVIK